MRTKIIQIFNTPSLIEHHWKHVNQPKTYYSVSTGNSVEFDERGDIYFEHEVSKDDLYKVEVEYNGQD